MTDAAALLAEILANPDDDEPRLVYADWLGQHDDPRGELIQLQCELARRDGARELNDRANALLRRHEQRWGAEAGIRQMGVVWERGFPAGLIGGSDALLGEVDALRTQPITWLRLRLRSESIEEVAALPELAKIRLLELRPDPTSGQVRDPHAPDAVNAYALAMLGASSHLTGLRELVFSEGAVDRLAARSLVRAAWLPQLEELVMPGALLDRSVLAKLAGRIPAMRRLLVDRSELGFRGLEAIAESAMRELDMLSLARCDRAGLEALVRSESVRTVRCLSLAGTHAIDDDASVLATARELGILEDLDLAENAIGPAGAAALAASTTLRSLHRLDLRANQLGDAGAFALAEATGLSELVELDVSDNAIHAAAAERLRRRYRSVRV
ncbi:MAG TPA: TIGR02996 domain-containing protein [Kofleriaceae bacterium]|nr:TIGR02996 domain-containing protein [Kofleriaceae bacterium]